MRKSLFFIAFNIVTLTVNSQVRIVSVPSDGAKTIRTVSDPSLADYFTFTIKRDIKNSRMNLPISLPPKIFHVKLMPGSKILISETQRNGKDIIIGNGTWIPIINGYKATLYDNNGKEQMMFIDISHEYAYYTIFDRNAEINYMERNVKESSPITDLKFYRQTPFGYYKSDLYIKQEGLEVPILSLPQTELSKISSDPHLKSQIYKRNMPINLTEEYTISNNQNKANGLFEIGLFGVRDNHRIGYNINNCNLGSIINKFKEQKKSSEIILNTQITPEIGFSSISSSFLTSIIDNIKNTIDSRTSNCKRFIITAKIDTVSVNSKAETVQFTGNLSLYIVDIVTKQVFCRYTLCNIFGTGTNSDQAIKSSLSVLNGKHSDISLFIKRGIHNINVYYKNILSKPLDEIIAPYLPLRNIGYEETNTQFENMEKSFDNAIEYLLSTPRDHECYSKSLDYATFLAYIKAEYHYRYLLKQASKLVGWSNNQTKTKQNNNKALSLLKEIPKESYFFDEASYFINEAKRNLLSGKEELDDVVKMGEKAHNSMLSKNKRVAMPNVQSNSASGIFTLGVLMLAAAVAAPAAAPASIILIIL